MLERFTRRSAKGLPQGATSSATITQYPFTTSMTCSDIKSKPY